MAKRIALLAFLFVLGWSSGGSATSLISFTAFDRDGDAEIYAMGADGSNPINLTNNTAHDEHSAWSPDGSQIAFRSDRDGNREIYVMDSDGSNPTRITTNSARDQEPAWSPDGLRIAFSSNRDGAYEIYVMNSDGTNPERLTNHSAQDGAPPGPRTEVRSRFYPGGMETKTSTRSARTAPT